MPARGLSCAAALGIGIIIFLLALIGAVMLWSYLYPPPLVVYAEMTRSALIDNGTQQLLAFSFIVASHMKEPAELVKVVANVTTENGTRVLMTLSPGSPSVSVASVAASLAYSGDGPLPLPPGRTRTLYVNLTAPVDNPIVSVQFELVFVTSSGEVMTFTSAYSVNATYAAS